MKVTIDESKKANTFQELAVGQPFKEVGYHAVFIRIQSCVGNDELVNAVCLQTGVTYYFAQSHQVEILDGEFKGWPV